MDGLFRQLRMQGIYVKVKHAPEITKVEESHLWENGVLGASFELTPGCALLQWERLLFQRRERAP